MTTEKAVKNAKKKGKFKRAVKRAAKSTAQAVKNYRSERKIRFDKLADPALFWVGSNAAYLYGANEALDYVAYNVDSNEGLAMLGAYTALAGGLIAANKFVFRPVSRKIKEFHKKRSDEGKQARASSWVRTMGQTGSLAALYLMTNFPATLDAYRRDAVRVVNAFAREDTRLAISMEDERRIDITPSGLELSIPADLDLSSVRESNMYSPRGKFLRTYRWDNIITETERRYGLEEGILAGLIMRESFGNPLQLNLSKDGGAGLMMFQPGTARAYGLEIYGDSHTTGRDRHHGQKLAELVREHEYDYAELAAIDERFDVVKSTDAAARYLRDMYRQHGSWNKALSAYNRGRPARRPGKTRHVRMTRTYQRHYLEQKAARGGTVDRDVAERLEAENGFDFSYVRTNSQGRGVFRYEVDEGDTPTSIADRFNRWDKRKGDRYRDAGYSNVVNRNGGFVGSHIRPNQRVYVVARKR